MTGFWKRSAAALALTASMTMVASPALARDWGGRWGGHHRHHDRVDAGDIFAGLLIIGGIAAIASAASKANKQKREAEQRDVPPEPYRDNRADYGNDRGSDDRPEWRDGGGIDGAVNRCIDEVNRGKTRVAEVNSVNRDADGWRVAGTTTDRSDFSCTIDRNGQIRNLNVDGLAV